MAPLRIHESGLNNTARPRKRIRRERNGSANRGVGLLLSSILLTLPQLQLTHAQGLDIVFDPSSISAGDTSITDNSTSAILPLQDNSTMELTPAPTVMPAVTPPVLPPTTSYFSVNAWFVLMFNLDSTNSNAGLMNESQTALFRSGMESLTQEFAEGDEWQKVVTMCSFQEQQQVDSLEATFIPIPTLMPSTSNGTVFPELYTNDTGQPTQLSLMALADVNASMSTVSPTAAPTTTVTRKYFYEYLFQMTYLSSAINVSLYPQRLVNYTNENVDTLTLDLQRILDLTPENNLNVTSMEEVAQLTPNPTVTTPSPTGTPSLSAQPSLAPSISVQPTISPQPSHQPSIAPSMYPSTVPSNAPTMFPTFLLNSSSVDNFALDFTLQAPEGAGYLNNSQEDEFCQIMVNQTPIFAPQGADRVRTNCIFFEDTYVRTTVAVPIPTPVPSMAPSQETETRRRLNKRRTQETYLTTIYTYTYTFRMRYTSASQDVADYTDQFQRHIANNAQGFNERLTILLGLTPNNNLTLVAISVFNTKSASPSDSSSPSEPPSLAPTIKETPFPTWEPTPTPSSGPSVMPSTLALPSMVPSIAPTTPLAAGTNQVTVIIVIAVVAIIAGVTMAGMAWFYRTRRQSKLEQENRIKRRTSESSRKNNRKNNNGMYPQSQHSGMDPYFSHSHQVLPTHNTVATSPTSLYQGEQLGGGLQFPPHGNAHRLIMSPSTSESILSNPSLLSNGQDEDEDDEDDEEHTDLFVGNNSKLATIDDFDQFKDQNLEKMRSDVEQSVRGIDGMMSQALTMAILGGGSSESLPGDDSIEMEANALCEVTDWMKRHEVATLDERNVFLQEMLNKMVTSVRQGIMGPDDASRTIHECAALLNLQLANDLPNTTVILTGMRKTVRANDVIRTFRKFGPIEDAAVASNQRGFGIVRFRTPKTVDQVMMRFRTSEIVVQDVAVQCKILEPDR